MAHYETVLIARQDVSAAQVETIADMAQEILTEAGGSIARREYWGLRSLAFRMNKNRKGHYVLMNYDVGSDAVVEMERRLRLHDDVLRFMTVRTEDLPTEPSVVL
ncbi:MAG TPA: 30S ribosomal protein S6, partial [Rhodospirillaceae bacterium]|nr:30S ribosomal protein S6 [Rhodospirillaceae bacterium]